MVLFLGFVLGIAASGVAAVVFDHMTSPKLEVVIDPGPRALGDLPGGTKLEYHHVLVRNVRTAWPLPGRRPAWACQANLTIFKWTGEPLTVVPVRARWASQPMPVSSFVVGDRVIQATDMAKMIAGRRIDIFTHQDERLTIALKHQGQTGIHLFTNESLEFERGCNPAWKLEPGTYRLRVAVFYERGEVLEDFEFSNTGATLDDVTIKRWSGHTNEAV
jgi:hypothetical protein